MNLEPTASLAFQWELKKFYFGGGEWNERESRRSMRQRQNGGFFLLVSHPQYLVQCLVDNRLQITLSCIST